MWRPVVLSMLAVSLCSAASIIGTSGSGFDTYKWTGQSGKLNNNGNPYFDLASAQGGSCNVAFYITGQSSGNSCSPAMQPGNIDRIGANNQGPHAETNYWDKGNSSTPDPSVHFSQKSASFMVTLMAEGSANNAQNSFGAYYVDPITNQIVTLLLFDGATGPGSAVAFTPGDYDFGFYIDDGTNTYYTQSQYNRVNASGAGLDTTVTHFAFFRDPADTYNNSASANWDRLWLGASGGTEATRDFNDMIATVTVLTGLPPSHVPIIYAPEPSTLALATSGALLIALALFGRRRSKP